MRFVMVRSGKSLNMLQPALESSSGEARLTQTICTRYLTILEIACDFTSRCRRTAARTINLVLIDSPKSSKIYIELTALWDPGEAAFHSREASSRDASVSAHHGDL